MPAKGRSTSLTRETYEKLVEAFRRQPGAYASAARLAACDPRTAKRCWDGPPRVLEPWAIPIKRLLEEEAEATAQARRDADKLAAVARAEANAAALAKEAKEKQDALDEERRMLKFARGDVVAALAISAELVPAMRQVARSITKALEPDPNTGAPPVISPQVAMGLLTRYAQMVQKAVGAAEVLAQLARTERGEANINVAVGVGPAMSEEEALAELEAIEEVMQARRGPPLLTDGEAA